jgi:hypothetical protein
LALKAFLVLVVGLLAWGLWTRQVGSLEFDEALAQVLDGDLDREGRLAALRVLRDLGSSGTEADDGKVLVAAMAAVVLNDRQAYERAADRLSPLLVDSSSGADILDRASLGETCLRSLLMGLSAESRGDIEEAKRLYRQAEISAPLGNLPLAEMLARNGLERLR